jgi:very-short-patch-repair endonuclease
MLQKKSIEPSMYYNAKPLIFERAKQLRENMTHAESFLWQQLNKKQLGVRFKTQHPMDIFIADFYCHQAKLVIEIDGKIHLQQQDYDDGRNAELERLGIKVIRFTNEEVLGNIDKVMQEIRMTLQVLLIQCSSPE